MRRLLLLPVVAVVELVVRVVGVWDTWVLNASDVAEGGDDQ